MAYIKLNLDFESAIKRTVVVPGEFSLAFLHLVIQEVFGWYDYHQYKFTRHGERKGPEWTEPCADDFATGREVDSATVAIAEFLEKTGSRLDYEYDFGDGNEVSITSLGVVERPDPQDCEAIGPMAIEDCRGFGGMAEIIKIAKAGKGAKFRQLNEWLGMAFGKSTDDVLKVPNGGDVYGRTFKLVKLACTADPRHVNDCWKAYLR